MSTNRFVLRMGGILPPTKQLSEALKLLPTEAWQRGNIRHNHPVEKDYWHHNFMRWEGLESIGDEIPDEAMAEITEALLPIANVLASFDLSLCWKQILLETSRTINNSLLILPAKLLKLFALCNIDFYMRISITDDKQL